MWRKGMLVMLKCAIMRDDAFPAARNSSVDSSYRSTLWLGHKRSNKEGGSNSFLPHILQGLQFSCENMRFSIASCTGLEGRTWINNDRWMIDAHSLTAKWLMFLRKALESLKAAPVLIFSAWSGRTAAKESRTKLRDAHWPAVASVALPLPCPLSPLSQCGLSIVSVMRMCRAWNVPNCRDCRDCGDCTDQAQHIEEVAPGVESWCCHWSAKWANASSAASQCDGNWMKLKLLLGNEPQKNSNSNIRTIYSWSEALSESSSRVHAGKSAPKSHKYICPASQQSMSIATGRWAMHNKDKP